MSHQETTSGQSDVPVGYQAPRVERVLTPAGLEQEILYAGIDEVSTDRPI
jgi:hypothetical protein